MPTAEQLKRQFGLPFYRPHPKQDAFHRAFDYKGRYLRTGNRFGKSDCGAAEDCAWLLGERVWYPKGDSARTGGIPKHPVKGLLVCQDNDKAEEVFLSMMEGDRRGKFFNFLPEGHVKYSKKGKFINQLEVPRLDGRGTSVLKVYTEHAYKQNPLGAESSDWDFIHVDEPISKSLWEAVSRGLMDRNGKYWFTCTPLKQAWINHHFIPPEMMRSGTKEHIKHRNLWTTFGTVWDNPYISEEAVNDYLSTLSPSERACREKGIPIALSGLVYKEFDPDRHLLKDVPHGWDDWVTPPLNYTLRVLIDLHPKKPHAVSFWATSPTGQKINFYEIYAQVLIPALIEHIKAVVGSRFVYQFLCDPIAWIVNPVTGSCWADEFFKEGLPIQPASKQLEYGITKTQAELSKESLYFSPNCIETIHEFDNYSWQDNKEKPEDDRDHMMENLYRFVLSGGDWIDTSSGPPKAPKLNLSDSAAAIRLRGARSAISFAQSRPRGAGKRDSRYPR